MGLFKKIFGLDTESSSAQKGVLNLDVEGNNTPATSSDSIITYKKEYDVVYGYLNQKALDTFLFNRAKERTNNFQSKNQWDDEIKKRPVKLGDISSNNHTICDHPIIDGEYVEEGDVILAVGLDAVKFSNFCRANCISEYETWLYCGVKLYSSYSGFFTNIVKDNMVGSCNLGNTIKDGDLLFTITLADKPKEVETSTIDVQFTHSLLNRDFLESIPYLKDIAFKQWLANDYTKVNKGDDVMEITEYTSLEPRFSTTIKAPTTGLLLHRWNSAFSSKLFKGNMLFTIVEDEYTMAKYYPNEVEVTQDDFTNAITIKGKLCAGDHLGFKLGSIWLNFENVAGRSSILLVYERKDVNLNKKCALHLLLDDGGIITINAIANPIKLYASYSIIKYPITKNDITKLGNSSFIKWQITNEEGIAIKVGTNICCLDSKDSSGITQSLSFDVFQSFVNDFQKAIEDNVIEDETEQIEEPSTNKTSETCYVYLMKDSANNFHKIGISNHPRYREHTLQSDKPTIELLCAKEYPNRTIALSIEAALHKAYASKRLRGEWFNLDDSDVMDVMQTLR